MRQLIFCCLIVVANNGFAVELPKQCKALSSINDKVMVATKGEQQLVLLYNQSQNPIWLTHRKKSPGAGAGWTTKLSPGKWSALAINSKEFALGCVESRPGHEQQIACKAAIVGCHKLDAKFGEKAAGSYWAAEDMSLNPLLARVNQRHIDTASD